MSTGTGAPSNEDVKYNTETVKAIRGMERRTIAKREADGWELVSQTPGTLRTELTFRRPQPKTPWRLYAILGGVMVALFVFIGIMAAITGDDEPAADAVLTPTTAASTPAAEQNPTEKPSESPAPSPSASVEPSTPQAVPITVDQLLDKLNSAEMGGIKNGDRFLVTGTLFNSHLWMTGRSGDYVVMLEAQGGAQDLPVFADESEAASWTDGTKVEMVLEAVDATIDGETTGGWMRAISTKVIP